MYQYFTPKTLRGLGLGLMGMGMLGTLGATETRNPLPEGQYTIDVYGDDRAKMASWLATNKAHVVILATATEEADTDEASNDTYTWITQTPLSWPGTFGYPEIMSEVAALPASASSAPAVVRQPVTYTMPAASTVGPLTVTRAVTTATPPTSSTAATAASSSSASPSSTPAIVAAALLVLGGGYYYAKKKGMI